ncbi:MAG TPA: DcrB-related protein [Tepidisphaeraceae bacterium]|nr:DcrB-related protein [Tepidisphaeraceae bacterium]
MKNKSALVVALILTLALAFAARAADPNTTPVDLTAVKPTADAKDHKAADGSWAAKYPATWEAKKSQTGADMFLAQLAAGAAFRQNVIIKPLAVPEGVTLDAFVKEALADIQKQIQGVTVETSAPLTTPGHAGHLFIYSGPFQALKLKWAQAFILQGKSAYLMTFTCEQAAFDTHWPAAQQIMATFKGQ